MGWGCSDDIPYTLLAAPFGEVFKRYTAFSISMDVGHDLFSLSCRQSTTLTRSPPSLGDTSKQVVFSLCSRSTQLATSSHILLVLHVSKDPCRVLFQLSDPKGQSLSLFSLT